MGAATGKQPYFKSKFPLEGREQKNVEVAIYYIYLVGAYTYVSCSHCAFAPCNHYANSYVRLTPTEWKIIDP
jgi:hypothetical protein